MEIGNQRLVLVQACASSELRLRRMGPAMYEQFECPRRPGRTGGTYLDVAVRHVAQHAGHDLPSRERVPVGAMRLASARVAEQESPRACERGNVISVFTFGRDENVQPGGIGGDTRVARCKDQDQV